MWIAILSLFAVVMYINRSRNEKYDDKKDSVADIDPWRFGLPTTRPFLYNRVASPLIRW